MLRWSSILGEEMERLVTCVVVGLGGENGTEKVRCIYGVIWDVCAADLKEQRGQ
jgi:hypothetical protein